MKRCLDVLVAASALLLLWPFIVVILYLIWRQDHHSPFYIAPRAGRGNKPFRMVKLRSMVINADKSGVDSTAADDRRITAVGHFIRRWKLDEMAQLWNVLRGEMSLVGPRPNVEREVALYTEQEMHLLDLRPGITDMASIVFADEGDILAGSEDPDLLYNQIIRPWKSRLGLLYVQRASALLDMQLIGLTLLASVARPRALTLVARLASRLGAAPILVRLCCRREALRPFPPPGAAKVVASRKT